MVLVAYNISYSCPWVDKLCLRSNGNQKTVQQAYKKHCDQRHLETVRPTVFKLIYFIYLFIFYKLFWQVIVNLLLSFETLNSVPVLTLSWYNWLCSEDQPAAWEAVQHASHCQELQSPMRGCLLETLAESPILRAWVSQELHSHCFINHAWVVICFINVAKTIPYIWCTIDNVPCH